MILKKNLAKKRGKAIKVASVAALDLMVLIAGREKPALGDTNSSSKKV